jgi:pyruvate formate lyase activating enzyme
MVADIKGYIHSVETAGTVDGPGIRFVIFLTGCPLRCLYCHNPDTHQLKSGRIKTARKMIEEVAKYKDYLKNMGGGVTITGGEPLFQPEFTAAILKGCKELGLHTALDTNGFLGNKVPVELLDAADLVLLDIKSFDPAAYRKITGARLQPTLDFARMLSALHKPMWIRFVLVPGLTDDFKMIENMVEFVQSLGCVEHVEVLPFHKMGETKWEELNLKYTLKETPPPSADLVRRTRTAFSGRGWVVV